MKKEEFIRRYGEEAYKETYENNKENKRLWNIKNRDKVLENAKNQAAKYREKMKSDPLYRFKTVFYTRRGRYEKANSND